MPDFTIDREMLESFSTSEIKRILREDYDDYTTEAIEIFKDILESRGQNAVTPGSISFPGGDAGETNKNHFPGNYQINNPGDAIDFLNGLLSGVMKGTIDTEKARVSAEIVLAILKAHESAFMTEGEEE